MNKVICPQCKEIIENPDRVNIEAYIDIGFYECPHCGFKTSAWQFDVIIEEPEEEESHTLVGVLHPCGG